MSVLAMNHDEDPRDKITQALGDISGFKLLNNQVLVAVYVRPEKTKSGIYLSDKYRDEDRSQGKIGLLVSHGPSAFNDQSGEWFGDNKFEIGSWLVFRPSDGWPVTVNGVLCRILSDTQIKGIADNPDRVW